MNPRRNHPAHVTAPDRAARPTVAEPPVVVDEKVPKQRTPAEKVTEEEKLAEAAETARRAQAQEDYLAQKISTKLLYLEASQISVLQNNGVKTLADFMAQTESSFASMKVKKGIPFTARFLKEQELLKRKLESL